MFDLSKNAKFSDTKKSTTLSMESLVENLKEDIKKCKEELDEANNKKKKIEQEYSGLQQRANQVLAERKKLADQCAGIEKSAEEKTEETIKRIFCSTEIFDKLNKVIVKSEYVYLSKRLEQMKNSGQQDNAYYEKVNGELLDIVEKNKNIIFSGFPNFIEDFKEEVIKGEFVLDEDLKIIKNSSFEKAQEFCKFIEDFKTTCKSNKFQEVNCDYNDKPENAITVVRTIQNFCKGLLNCCDVIKTSLEKRSKDKKMGIKNLKDENSSLELRYRSLGLELNRAKAKAEILQNKV